MPSAFVVGTANLGAALVDHFVGLGWSVAALGRDLDRLEAVRRLGATPYQADALDPEQLRDALRSARRDLGDLSLLANAASTVEILPDEPWGGGPMGEVGLERFRSWSATSAELAFSFLGEGARALRESEAEARTLVQVTNALAHQTAPGMGSWAAGQSAIRALTRTAAEELRDEEIRAVLLTVEGPIENAKIADMIDSGAIAREATVDQRGIAEAVAYLAGQSQRALSYELRITASRAKP